MAEIIQANMKHHRQLLTQLIKLQAVIDKHNREISEVEDR